MGGGMSRVVPFRLRFPQIGGSLATAFLTSAGELALPPFVTSLRARPGAVWLAATNASTVWTVRVQSAEAWDAVRVEVEPGTRLRDVKRAAMAALMPDVVALDEYVVKLRGIELFDEDASMQSAGVMDGSTLLVMSRRRQPLR